RGDPGWTTDWWRHVRELILPVDYLTRPYFDQWVQVYAALLIDSGLAELDELATGRARTPGPDLGPPMQAHDVPAAARHAASFCRAEGEAPRFVAGQQVRARVYAPGKGHTRLPRYVRGRPGTIHAYRANHLLPDLGAEGRELAEPLYTVAFRAADLWPEASESRDKIFLDLWESYLDG